MRYLFRVAVTAIVAGLVQSGAPEDDHDHHDHEGHDHDHEGHHDHHEEFSPEKMEAQARADFDQMDTGKDGYLTKEEIQEYLNDPSADAEIEDFFGKADADHDGKVSFAEYYQFVSDMYAEYQRQMEAAMGGDGSGFGDIDEMMGGLEGGWGEDDDDWGDFQGGHDEEL